jgi:hypothetical protein
MALKQQSVHPWLPHTLFAGLALTILAPLLRPGHILTMDMAFTPNIPMPDHVTSSYVFRVFLHWLNVLIPTQVIERLLLFTILFLSGWGAYRLARYLDKSKKIDMPGAFFAGAFYMINPFTYSRFMTGQYSVLLGYALIPFFVQSLLRFLATPTLRSCLTPTLSGLLISIVSIHTVGLIAVLSIIATVLTIWRLRSKVNKIKQIILFGCVGIVVGITASSYWLIPLIQGEGETAQIIASFDRGDGEAFATVGQGIVGQISNVIGLQGFWAEDRALYVLPHQQNALWGVAILAVWAIIVIGGITWWRRGRRLDFTLFGLAALMAVVLSVGDTSSWLAEYIPLFAGFREPHKFVGLVALLYALCVSRGVDRLIDKYHQKWGELTHYIISVSVALILILFTSNMFWGFGGQIQPRQYPKDWLVVQQKLQEDHGDYQALFLPWHLYMHFKFAGRIIANPAPQFFGKQVIVSNDPEFGEASPTSQDSTKRYISRLILPTASENSRLGTTLSQLDIKYILLAKDANVVDYDFLNQQKELKLMYEGPTIKLYRNEAFQR